MDSTRKRGGQPDNGKALKHGRFSVVKRMERRAKSLEAFEARSGAIVANVFDN